MNTAYLLTGGNLGNKKENLRKAKVLIEKICGPVIDTSPVYETAAWGVEYQPSYYNQVLKINTALTPQELLRKLQSIEKKMGRVRTIKYAPRIIDIDILLFGQMVIHNEHLTVPHPQLPYRRFALTPLADVAPNFFHPVLQKTIAQLLVECEDPLPVHKINI